jgi:anti-sigma B factor antagonist
MLSIKVDRNGDDQVICRLAGELELSAVAQFRQELADLPAGSRVLIEMSDVSFVDSAGLGVLIGGVRRTRDRGGNAAVACARPGLSRLLRTVGLDRLVSISDDIEHAMGALYGPAASLPRAV